MNRLTGRTAELDATMKDCFRVGEAEFSRERLQWSVVRTGQEAPRSRLVLEHAGPALYMRLATPIEDELLDRLLSSEPANTEPHTTFTTVMVGPRGETPALRCSDCGAIGVSEPVSTGSTADLAALIEEGYMAGLDGPEAAAYLMKRGVLLGERAAARPADGEDHELVTMRRAQLEAAESLLGFVADNKPIGPTGRNLASEMRDKFRAALAASPEGASE